MVTIVYPLGGTTAKSLEIKSQQHGDTHNSEADIVRGFVDMI